MPNRSPEGTIDERILRLLGLEDAFDLDVDEYYNLLREALVKRSFGGQKLSQEELALISNERKRIKQVPKQTKKITADKLATSKLLRPSSSIVPSIKGISKKSSALALKDDIGKNINDINQTLSVLVKSITEQNKIQEKSTEEGRKEKENLKRKKREELMESGFKTLKNLAQKALAPVQGILDRIIRFIVFTLLGRAFNMFMDWASDPKNADKIKSLGRFLKDWWPALLGAWFFFANPLGIFIRKITSTVVGLTLRLAKFAIPRLISFIAQNPVAAGIAAVAGTAILANEITGQRKAAPVQAETKAKAQTGRGLGVQGVGGVGDLGPTTPYGLLQPLSFGGIAGLGKYNQGYNKGGSFYGIVDKDTGTTVSGAGPDTQFLPIEGGGGAVLQRGETVLQVGARERMIKEHGIDPLAYNVGSNANKPRTISKNIVAKSYGGILGYMGGGSVGTAANIIKKDEALSSLSPGRNDFIKPGGKSILSNINWSKLSPQTPIHAYSTGVSGDRPTIGWGSTFYDNIMNGSKPVRPGDIISKKQADDILEKNIQGLYSTYSKQIPSWNKMNSNQQAAILSVGYNAPFGPIGAYPKLTSSLKSGNVKEAAKNVQRQGPNPERIKMEQNLLLSSMKPKPKSDQKKPAPTKEPNFIEKITSGITSMFGMQKKQHGGPITENTGMDIPGATADRQLLNVAVQPGEYKYIFTKAATDRGAVDLANIIQARLDSNSAAAKSGKYKIEPPVRRGRGGMITLPPITQSSGSKVPVNQSVGTIVPTFSVVSSAAQEIRMQNAERYGIV